MIIENQKGKNAMAKKKIIKNKMVIVKAKSVQMVAVGKIIPHPKNPNFHSENQIVKLSEIIQYQGFRTPLVVSNKSGFLNQGHGRLEAAKRLGMATVPVIFEDFDNDAQEYASLVSDNEIARAAKLDIESIKIDSKSFKINLEHLGFDDISQFVDVAGHKRKIGSGESDDDEVEIPDHGYKPVSKKGQVWILGKHRLMCGDSTNESDVAKLMGKERAQIAFTSPPYNAGAEVEIGGADQKYETHQDDMTGRDYLGLLNSFTKNSLKYSDISIVNIQQLAGNKLPFIDYLNEFKNSLVDIAIWNKTYGTPCLPKRCMNSAFEYVLFFSNEKNPPKTIKTAPEFHGNINNVYTAPKQSSNEFANVHRATFPMHLPTYFIENFSTGNVLDLFNGTGTTMIACENLGRSYFGMEMDPIYVDVTIKRWQKLTGKKCKLLSTGEQYDKLCK
jgi:DNA modification methylase